MLLYWSVSYHLHSKSDSTHIKKKNRLCLFTFPITKQAGLGNTTRLGVAQKAQPNSDKNALAPDKIIRLPPYGGPCETLETSSKALQLSAR